MQRFQDNGFQRSTTAAARTEHKEAIKRIFSGLGSVKTDPFSLRSMSERLG